MSLPAYYADLFDFMDESASPKDSSLRKQLEKRAVDGIMFNNSPVLSGRQIDNLLFELRSSMNYLLAHFESSYKRYDALRKNGVRLNHTERLWVEILEKALPDIRQVAQSTATNRGERSLNELQALGLSADMKSVHTLMVALIQFYMFEMQPKVSLAK